MAAGIVLSLSSCGNFLEENSQNMAYLEKVEDLDELLLGECYLKKGYSFNTVDAATPSGWNAALKSPCFPAIHLMDDDVEEYVYFNRFTQTLNYPRLQMCNLHYWQKDPFRDSEFKEIKEDNWSGTYRRIAVINTILSDVDGFRDDDIRNDSICDRIKGEALFLRAQNYFWLANLYARPYCKATSTTDGCVPLKINEAVEGGFFRRSPMEEVYGQIRQDLLDAVEAFRGGDRKWVYRANQDAAFALLSRVSLYTERYEDAVCYADSILCNSVYHLLDFNSRQAGDTTSVMYASSPETIFTQGPNIMGVLHSPYTSNRVPLYRYADGYTSSADLLACYEENDLRLDAFFLEREKPTAGKRCVKWRNYTDDDEVSDCWALRLPEVYLNKAEALALLGRDGDAIAVINELRKNRIKNGEMEEISYSGRELVEFIRQERRRELCFEGHRWFDLRRYAVNTEYPVEKSIEHISLTYVADGAPEGQKQGRYVLRPYSEDAAAYMLPIPRDEIEYNGGDLSNEERIERPLQEI